MKADFLYDRKTCLQACTGTFQPGNVTGWGSEGVKFVLCPSASLSVCVCVPVSMSVCVCVPASLSVSVCLPLCLCLCASPSVCVCVPASPSVCVCVPASLSVCLCLSVYLPLSVSVVLSVKGELLAPLSTSEMWVLNYKAEQNRLM